MIKETVYGQVLLAEVKDLYEELWSLIKAVIKETLTKGETPVIGLSGGATPQAFYSWAVREKNIRDADLLQKAVWTASDERWVRLDSPQSNFGVADRLFLAPLGISNAKKLPWPVDKTPVEGASQFEVDWIQRFGPQKGFDLCLLGLGSDAHTASFFPGCPLIDFQEKKRVSIVEWPGKDWRGTVTPYGLTLSGKIAVLVTGQEKAEALKNVFNSAFNPNVYPAQILKDYAAKTCWFVDAAF